MFRPMPSGRVVGGFLLPALCALFWAAHASAAASDPHPLRPADRSSPRATLETFLESAEARWEEILERRSPAKTSEPARRAIRCLDLRDVPPAQQDDLAIEAVLLLFDVLNRVDVPPLPDVPGADDEAVRECGEWTIPHTPIAIVRIDEGPRSGEWLFSREVVDRAKEMYRRTRSLPVRPGAIVDDGYQLYISAPGSWISAGWIDTLPPAALRVYGEQALWQWAAAALVLVLFLVLSVAALRAFRAPPRPEGEGAPARSLLAPLSLLLLSSASLYVVDEQVNLTGPVLAAFRFFFYAVFFLAAIVGTSRLGRVAGSGVAEMPRFRRDPLTAGFVTLAVRIVAGVGVLGVIGLWAYTLGLPVLAVLTGLGVGGIAVALATQSTLENFIGSMALFADRPVRIGDACVFGDQTGTVEHIGLRSTRIRTAERSVLTIPNAEFSRLQIENLAERDRRRFSTNLSLFLGTSAAQIERVRSQILDLLQSDARVVQDGTRVELVAIGPASIDLEIHCFIRTRDHAEFLAIRRELLLEIVHIVEEAGTGLAAPGQTQYVRESKEEDAGV